MSFAPKKALVIGATSGIGQATASRLAKAGSSVIVTGRREDRLKQFVADHAGAQQPVKSYALDLAKVDDIAPWVQRVTAENPDIDCVILNAGIQRAMDLTEPENIKWNDFHEETAVNYTSHVVLSVAFLSFFRKHSVAGSLVFVSSALALVPLPRVPSYSASKAAAHHFVLSLRHQLKEKGNVKIIEVIPPMVATELQDQQGHDAAYGRAFGIPVDKFIDDMFAGLDAGKDQIPVGLAVGHFDNIEVKRQQAMAGMAMGVTGMQQKLSGGSQ